MEFNDHHKSVRNSGSGELDGGPVDGDYVHPEAQSLYAALPFMRYIPLASEAMSGYGPRPVFALGACSFINKGLSSQLLYSSAYAMLVGRFGIDAMRYQRLGSMGTLGWSLNPFTAMLCDTFACLGYTKRWYMCAFSLISGVLAVIYGVLPAKTSSANTAAAFFFLASFGHASIEVLSEGFYTRRIRQRPRPGPAFVGHIWASATAGAIVALAINGPVSDQGKPQVNIILSGAVQIVVTLIFIVNWYQEQRNFTEREEDAYVIFKETLALQGTGEAPRALARRHAPDADARSLASAPHAMGGDDERELMVEEPLEEEVDDTSSTDSGPTKAERKRRDAEGFVFKDPPKRLCGGLFECNVGTLRDSWRICVYTLIMTAAVIAMTVGTMFADTLGLLLILVIVSTICCATSFWALPLIIAKANTFIYLAIVVDITVQGPLYAFYVSPPSCVPDGPHFSYTFYSTIGPIVGNVTAIVAINAFNYIFRTQRYRLVFVLTILITILGNLFDLIIVKRWNVAIGIPDLAMYLFGGEAVSYVCFMFSWMPMVVLISRLCPRGSESMVFAVMMGFRTIGQSTAAQVGTVILEFGWTVPSCDFSNLPMVLLVCRILCPLLGIPMVFLVPNARICDDIDIEGNIVQAKMEERELAATKPAASKASSAEEDQQR